MPNVISMDSQQAKSAVTNANLKYVEKPVYSPQPKGRVQKQSPNGGTTAAPGSTVTVEISQGPEMTVIPDANQIIGKDVADATATLQNAKLQVVSESQASSQPKNQVLSMDQKAGDQVPVQTVVTLKVSDNSLMTMPDLSKLTPDQALAALKQAQWAGDANGLVQTTKEDPNQALWGRILSQRPAAKDVISKNSVIAVTVATEPHIPMPDLTDKTVGQAEQELQNAGWYGQLIVKVHQEITPPRARGT